ERPPTWWQGVPRSGLFGCCRIAAVERVHHRLDPRRDEHLRRIGRALRHALDLRRFIFLEPRQDVIREIALIPAPPDPEPEPRELVAEMRDHRLQPVVPAGRPALPR